MSVLTLGQDTADRLLTASEVLAPYMPVFFAAFIVAFFCTPLMRMLAIKNGVVDMPDFRRKMHLQPVAYLGGVAIFLGWLAGMALCHWLVPNDPKSVEMGASSVTFPFPIVVGAAVITLTGVIDDVYGVSPRIKVGGQLFAAAALVSMSGVGEALVMDTFTAIGLNFEYMDKVAYALGAVIIAAFVLGGCNSMNLLDGMDGLASGVAGIASIGFLFISIFIAIGVSNPEAELPGVDIWISPVRIVMCLAILGAILGFMPYNFNPANIFMGDAGSLLLGYLCVSTIVLMAHAPGAGPALVMAGTIVFALPIIDTTLAIVRRKLAGRPIFSPDSQHLHHQLRKAGLSVKQTVLAMYGLAAFFGALGCLLVFLRWRYVLALFVVMFAFVTVTAYKSAQTKLLLKERDEKEGDHADTPVTDLLALNGLNDSEAESVINKSPANPAASEPANPPAPQTGGSVVSQ